MAENQGYIRISGSFIPFSSLCAQKLLSELRNESHCKKDEGFPRGDFCSELRKRGSLQSMLCNQNGISSLNSYDAFLASKRHFFRFRGSRAVSVQATLMACDCEKRVMDMAEQSKSDLGREGRRSRPMLAFGLIRYVSCSVSKGALSEMRTRRTMKLEELDWNVSRRVSAETSDGWTLSIQSGKLKRENTTQYRWVQYSFVGGVNAPDYQLV
ncbi:Hypothetical_protein [Hexamita inflata]|uniref:Hypothetical_protein n=1 Tax=Hexamita inflata TaxID=28002 RepID=A0AA86RAY1_9EUKA|nr:Hypothetical protein HINF_LOCUS61715 [Hexamita inflata]